MLYEYTTIIAHSLRVLPKLVYRQMQNIFRMRSGIRCPR